MVLMEDNTRPFFSIDDAIVILKTYYDIKAQMVTELSAELDRNFHVIADDNKQYVLKVAHASLSDSILDLQNSALKHLAQAFDIFPRLIPTMQSENMTIIEMSAGQTYSIRLLNYLVGTPLADFRPHTANLFSDMGTKLGQLSQAMQSFTHDEKRLEYRWNILNFRAVTAYMDGMPEDKQNIIQHFLDLYDAVVVPQVDDLRYSFIYNDANDHNILVQAKSFDEYIVSGMIDFGDMVYSLTVAELAVALAYAMMNKEHPLSTASDMIRAYHEVFPLTENEIEVLIPLVCARLCMSVCISWYQQQQDADNAHLSISEEPAWNLLHQLYDIHPRLAHYIVCDACGLEPCPDTNAVMEWLSTQSFEPILETALTPEQTVILDLSIGSPDLGTVDEMADTVDFTHNLFHKIMKGRIGIGRYNEARPIYLGEYFSVSHHERRAIHLGVDLFAPMGTPVFAPLAGQVFSIVDNAGYKDYGPTLILEHTTTDDVTFYTLYGHLHESVLDKWTVGDAVQAGAEVALMGSFPCNGDWSPHLHFQLITDMLDRVGEFAGVVSPCYRNVWLSLSPDPSIMLGLSKSVDAGEEGNHNAIIETRQKQLNPSMSLSYKQPLKIQRGDMHYLYDENGQAYLDCVNNVPHVGHSNPRVVKAGQRQMAVLNTNTRYLHYNIAELSTRLCATLPDSLSVCFFVNSGSEANELAMRLAETYTSGSDFIVADHAYHGHTKSLIQVSPYKFNGKGGMGKPDFVEIATIPDGYRGEFRGFDSSVGQSYAQSVQEAVIRIQSRDKQLAGFFSEGILGTGGQLPLPDDYLKTAYAMVRRAGGVCIADEVQVGFGRVGSHFWAFETQGVVPDIVTMGKPFGNGHPLAAVVTTRDIADAFNNGMEYFNTFGGNPVSCAIGLEVLNIIEEEGLQQNAFEVGEYWMDCFRQLQAKYPLIGHVRGKGLFIGVELIRNHDTLEPADMETSYIVERMKAKGFLMSTEGYLHNVLKIKPPIIFKYEHVDLFMTAFEEVLQDDVLQSKIKI